MINHRKTLDHWNIARELDTFFEDPTAGDNFLLLHRNLFDHLGGGQKAYRALARLRRSHTRALRHSDLRGQHPAYQAMMRFFLNNYENPELVAELIDDTRRAIVAQETISKTTIALNLRTMEVETLFPLPGWALGGTHKTNRPSKDKAQLYVETMGIDEFSMPESKLFQVSNLFTLMSLYLKEDCERQVDAWFDMGPGPGRVFRLLLEGLYDAELLPAEKLDYIFMAEGSRPLTQMSLAIMEGQAKEITGLTALYHRLLEKSKFKHALNKVDGLHTIVSMLDGTGNDLPGEVLQDLIPAIRNVGPLLLSERALPTEVLSKAITSGFLSLPYDFCNQPRLSRGFKRYVEQQMVHYQGMSSQIFKLAMMIFGDAFYGDSSHELPNGRLDHSMYAILEFPREDLTMDEIRNNPLEHLVEIADMPVTLYGAKIVADDFGDNLYDVDLGGGHPCMISVRPCLPQTKEILNNVGYWVVDGRVVEHGSEHCYNHTLLAVPKHSTLL